jgi:hypothetical protein
MVGTDDDMLCNAVKRMGMLGVSVRKMKALTMKMDTVTVIETSRWQKHTLFKHVLK